MKYLGVIRGLFVFLIIWDLIITGFLVYQNIEFNKVPVSKQMLEIIQLEEIGE